MNKHIVPFCTSWKQIQGSMIQCICNLTHEIPRGLAEIYLKLHCTLGINLAHWTKWTITATRPGYIKNLLLRFQRFYSSATTLLVSPLTSFGNLTNYNKRLHDSQLKFPFIFFSMIIKFMYPQVIIHHLEKRKYDHYMQLHLPTMSDEP